MLHSRVFPAALVAGVALMAPAFAAQEELFNANLVRGTDLRVIGDADAKRVRIEIADRYDGTYEAASVAFDIGNAMVSAEDANLVRFCADCPEVYFVTVHDASSSYGAMSGVVAYPVSTWWELALLPFDRAEVEDKDGDGIWSLWDSRMNGDTKQLEYTRYDFRDGFVSLAD